MSGSVPGRKWVLSAASQSQVQIGLDRVSQISFVLTNPWASYPPGNKEMQLQTDVPATQAPLETCLVYFQSSHPQNGDTGLSSRELSTGSVDALARLSGPGKNE